MQRYWTVPLGRDTALSMCSLHSAAHWTLVRLLTGGWRCIRFSYCEWSSCYWGLWSWLEVQAHRMFGCWRESSGAKVHHMAFWIDVSTAEWAGGWMHYVYRFSKGCTSCVINKISCYCRILVKSRSKEWTLHLLASWAYFEHKSLDIFQSKKYLK